MASTKITMNDIRGFRKCGSVARILKNKVPSFILSSLEYKPGYLVVPDRQIQSTQEISHYLYYPLKLIERNGRLYFNKQPTVLCGGIIFAAGHRAFSADIDEVCRGFIRAYRQVADKASIREFITGVNTANGTLPIIQQETAEDTYESESPTDISVPHIEQIDLLQYTQNPETFWAI